LEQTKKTRKIAFMMIYGDFISSGGAPLFQDGGSIDAFVPMNRRIQGDV